MRKRGFILPLVLLILALMSGIAVVLGRLSSEKTLSLKNQEGSYYAKEITVILVDSESDTSTGNEESPDGELDSENLKLKKKKEDETEKIEWKDGKDKFEAGNYNVTIVIDKSEYINWISEDKNGSVKFGKSGESYTGSATVGSNGKMTIYVNYTNSTNSDITTAITGSYTKN